MIYFLPLLGAIFNRFRGDDTSPKWLWIIIMSLASIISTSDPIVIAAWTLYVLCYAVPPTHPMLSGMMGRSPVRVDPPQWQWMQDASLFLRGFLPVQMTITETWRIYAIFYGFMRAIPSIAPVLFLYGYTGNPVMFFGLFLLLQGVPYYAFKKLLRINPNHGDTPVIYSELTIGYFLTIYLLFL